jgi:hypothetical protein
MWEKIKAFVVLEGKLQPIGSLEDLGVDGRTILKRIVKTYDGMVWTRSVCCTGTGGGAF